MKRNPVQTKKSSLLTAAVFLIVVLVIVLAALSFRVVMTIHKSIFDGQHQFVILMKSEQQRWILAVFSPTNRAVYVFPLQVSKNIEVPSNLHILVDAQVQTLLPIDKEFNIKNALLQTMFRPQTEQRSLTWYDMLRLYLMARTGIVTNKQLIRIPGGSITASNIQSIFYDSDIEKDNQTIQVINNTDKTGLGSRLEMTLSNMGANVVDVRSGTTQLNTSIITCGTMSFTVVKLEKDLHFPIRLRNDASIADIQISLGKDSVDSKTF